jgi:predicted O-methyltransferase YrrM
VYRVRDGIYAADMLLTALVHLDLFTWLASRPASKAEICRELSLVDRPADVMLTLLAAMGLIEEKDGRFRPTETAREHLVKGSPWFLGPYFASLKERPISLDLLQVLRTGKPANWGGRNDTNDWHKAMETGDFAASFTAAMDCRGVYLAQAVANAIDLARHRHLLDIAGGSGIYACSLVAHWPHLRATVLEKPPVHDIAAAAVADRGYSDRVSIIAGDMLASQLPAIADVHLFSNVLHDWDEPVVRDLLRKSFAALPAGGLVIVHDAYLNARKTGPLHVAEYSVMLLHACEGRCYSSAEMESYLTDAGFTNVVHAAGAAARGIIAGTKVKSYK